MLLLLGTIWENRLPLQLVLSPRHRNRFSLSSFLHSFCGSRIKGSQSTRGPLFDERDNSSLKKDKAGREERTPDAPGPPQFWRKVSRENFVPYPAEANSGVAQRSEKHISKNGISMLRNSVSWRCPGMDFRASEGKGGRGNAPVLISAGKPLHSSET